MSDSGELKPDPKPTPGKLTISAAVSRLEEDGAPPSPRAIHSAKKQKTVDDVAGGGDGGPSTLVDSEGDVSMDPPSIEEPSAQVEVSLQATIPPPNVGSASSSDPSIIREALPDIQAQAHHSEPEAPPTPPTPSNELLPELEAPDIIPEPASSEPEQVWDLEMTWGGKKFHFQMAGEDRLFDLKSLVYSLTDVAPERQKLIGLTKGKVAGDEEVFKSLKLPLKHRFIAVGTPEGAIFKDPKNITASPEVLDNFDVAYNTSQPGLKLIDDPRVQRQLKSKIEKCKIDVMNEPRPGKRLLVLDLDYTIVDTEPLLNGSLPPGECIRPGLHEFLELCYPHYDIAIWSQTHWRWLESKLLEMGMLDPERNYKLCFVADRTSMFPVFGTKGGQPYKHEIKPLAFLWSKFPQFGPSNTIHIDDLSRNFACNPHEGLKIRAFKGAGTETGMADHQLKKLGRYLLGLAQTNTDFTTVDHGEWKKYRPPPPPPGQ